MSAQARADDDATAGLLDRRTWRAADLRAFASEAGAPRARRPTDVALLALSVLTVVGIGALAPGPTAIGVAIESVVAATVGLLGWFWEICSALLLVWTLVLLVAAAVTRGRRLLLGEQLLAGGIALGGATLAGVAAGGGSAGVVDALLPPVSAVAYPSARLAVAAAVIVMTSPELSRPLRHAGRWVVALGAVAVVGTGVAVPIGVIAGLAIGFGAGAAVHLVFGSPGGRLPLKKVADALADLGVQAHDLEFAQLAARGVQLVAGRSADGRPLLVKVYGRDAWDGQLISSLWASLWYRDQTPSTRLNRVQQVEHEAFATLLAERAGVPVLPVVAAGLATGRDALLVIDADAAPLPGTAEPGDEVLAGLWAALERLHDIGIAHGRITPDRLMLREDGSPALADFAAATVAAKDTQIMADRAQLLVSTALVVGPDRAVRAAESALGSERLGDALPLIQPAALEPALRRAVKASGWEVNELREAAAAAAGREAPRLERLRRVTVTSFLTVVVVVFVAYVIISAIAGIGWSTLVDELSQASPWWVVAAILVAPVVQVGQAFSTLGASERPVRLGPVLALQYAIQFVALAVPSSAARVALAVRFFQKAGASVTAAAAVGVVDSLSGFLLEALVIVGIGLTGVVPLSLPGSAAGGALSFDGPVLAVLVGVLVLAIGVSLLVPGVRHFLGSRVADSKVALSVLHSRRNVAMLFLGNLGAQVMFAVVLGISLRAFGHEAPFAALLLVNTLVSLFAGLVPVPGGIGVTEAALTAGLVAVGVPSATALSAAIVYRLATYYIPPIYGAPAMSWLRRGGYV